METSRVVQRPVPGSQTSDPREYQLSQLRRRYSPKEHAADSSTNLTINIAPSDPDFPFEIDALKCTLQVPNTYPGEGRPSLRVHNQEMGRGYQINIENGFDAIVSQNPSATLLQQLNRLDKQLESLLAAPKADTIKLVSNLNKQTQADPVQQKISPLRSEPDQAQSTAETKHVAPTFSA